MYSDDLGNNIILTSKLNEGGEGEIYCVKNKPDLVAKIYFKEKINSELFEKIKVLCELSNSELSNFAILPRKIIYEDNKPVGYLMEKLTGYYEIHQLYGFDDKQTYFPIKNYDFMVNVAYNFIYALEVLHKNNIMIGDVNQNNIMINEQGDIKLVDCDSYQVSNNGKIHYCNVGKPEYTPAEFQGKKYRNLLRTQKSDVFSAGIIAFQILVFAHHPFSSVEAPSDIPTAITNNAFYYGNKNKKKTPIYSDIYNNLSPELQNIFNNVFNSNPKNRPSATEFRKALFNFKNDLIQCKKNKRHFHLKNSHCVWCELEKRKLYYFNNSFKEVSNNQMGIIDILFKTDYGNKTNKEVYFYTKEKFKKLIKNDKRILSQIINRTFYYLYLTGFFMMNLLDIFITLIEIFINLIMSCFGGLFKALGEIIIACFEVLFAKIIAPILSFGFLYGLIALSHLIFS